jgi:hypothetical protein
MRHTFHGMLLQMLIVVVHAEAMQCEVATHDERASRDVVPRERLAEEEVCQKCTAEHFQHEYRIYNGEWNVFDGFVEGECIEEA